MAPLGIAALESCACQRRMFGPLHAGRIPVPRLEVEAAEAMVAWNST